MERLWNETVGRFDPSPPSPPYTPPPHAPGSRPCTDFPDVNLFGLAIQFFGFPTETYAARVRPSSAHAPSPPVTPVAIDVAATLPLPPLPYFTDGTLIRQPTSRAHVCLRSRCVPGAPTQCYSSASSPTARLPPAPTSSFGSCVPCLSRISGTSSPTASRRHCWAALAGARQLHLSAPALTTTPPENVPHSRPPPTSLLLHILTPAPPAR